MGSGAALERLVMMDSRFLKLNAGTIALNAARLGLDLWFDLLGWHIDRQVAA